MRTTSPDIVEEHYSADFALLLCRLIGYREPLIDRLRDPAVKKTPAEMEYLAERLADPNHKWRTLNRF